MRVLGALCVLASMMVVSVASYAERATAVDRCSSLFARSDASRSCAVAAVQGSLQWRTCSLKLECKWADEDGVAMRLSEDMTMGMSAVRRLALCDGALVTRRCGRVRPGVRLGADPDKARGRRAP